jgi:hypothetical protein
MIVVERIRNVMEAIFTPEPKPLACIKKEASAPLSDSSGVRISHLPHKSSVVVVSYPYPHNEERDYFPPLDGFKEKISIDPYEIKVLCFLNEIARKIAFKFEIPVLVEGHPPSGK